MDTITYPHHIMHRNNKDRIKFKKKKVKAMRVKTNVGKTFLKLLQRHFPKRHRMYKIFNRNTVKISYCCMRNMESVISSHNKQILNPSKEYF